MKTVVIISTLTFLMIFGVIVITTGMIQDISGLIRMPGRVSNDSQGLEAVDRVRASLIEERDNIQKQLEDLGAQQLQRDVEQKIIDDQQARLEKLAAEIRTLQDTYTGERELAVGKLAKVYESMKPEKAAPILASMDIEEVLQIMTRMKDRQAAKILTSMNTVMASEISSRMGLKGDRQ